MKRCIFSIFALLSFSCSAMEYNSVGDNALQPFTQDEYKLYCVARAVGDLAFTAADELNKNSECPFTIKYFYDQRNSELNPYFNKTE